MRYVPLAERRAILGSLVGARPDPVADPGPLARLQHINLDDLDGMLLRTPGTMEVCSPTGIHTITVMSADGACRERIDGSVTHYRCEHLIEGALRSSAEMYIDPSADPPANCERTTGAGGCFLDPYPKAKGATGRDTIRGKR